MTAFNPFKAAACACWALGWFVGASGSRAALCGRRRVGWIAFWGVATLWTAAAGLAGGVS